MKRRRRDGIGGRAASLVMVHRLDGAGAGGAGSATISDDQSFSLIR